jgi:hypothetical protein
MRQSRTRCTAWSAFPSSPCASLSGDAHDAKSGEQHTSGQAGKFCLDRRDQKEEKSPKNPDEHNGRTREGDR